MVRRGQLAGLARSEDHAIPKSIVVTGVSGDVGRATAVAPAKARHKVYATMDI
jgi:hypothetical protein